MTPSVGRRRGGVVATFSPAMIFLLLAISGDNGGCFFPHVLSFRHAAVPAVRRAGRTTATGLAARNGRTEMGFGVGDGFGNGVDDSRVTATVYDTDADQGAGDGGTRRSFLREGAAAAAASVGLGVVGVVGAPDPASGAVGSLPEFADANAVVQGITVDVADRPQYDQTIEFFTKSFEGMKVVRERVDAGGGEGAIRETWLGFGPETFSKPPGFTLPVSSLAEYGGHASLRVRFDPAAPRALYQKSPGEYNEAPALGDSVAYLQMAVPLYRISQMVKSGGNILDAYAWVNVVSPAGLPVRGVVGISPDPIMFLAVNCKDVKISEEFYAKLGFERQEYPFARPNKGQGQFEPPQPAKSVYLAPSTNSMGVLLLPNKNRKTKGEVVPNPVVRSLNVIYTPSEGAGTSGAVVSDAPQISDPSSIPVTFVPADFFEGQVGSSSKKSKKK